LYIEEQRVIAAPQRAVFGDGAQQGRQLFFLQVMNFRQDRAPFPWDGGDAVTLIEKTRIPGRDVIEQTPDGHQAVISRLNRIGPRLFQMGQEPDDDLFVDVADQQFGGRPLALFGREGQEQFHRVPITLDRVPGHVSPTHQVVLEEGTNERSEVAGVRHGCFS
jgi:hypothetical protein